MEKTIPIDNINENKKDKIIIDQAETPITESKYNNQRYSF